MRLRPTRSTLLTLGSVFCIVAGGCEADGPGEWHDEGGFRWRELSVRRRGGPGFTQLNASRTGIEFANSIAREQMKQNRHLAQGSGVAVGDVDGDGLPDVYFARINGSNTLYRNLGNWRFEDITRRSGTAAPDRFSTGVVFADVDGDADLDLLVAALGGPNVLFENDGHGVFTEKADEIGMHSERGSMTMTLADIEGDGDLDLYVANYKVVNVNDLYDPRDLEFDRVVRRVGDRFEVVDSFRDHYSVMVREDLGLVIRSERAEPDSLYINDGSGHFESVSPTGGRFLDEGGNPLTQAPDYFTLTAKFYDVDQDRDPDLYVCSDFEHPDLFWLNDGNGIFRAVPRLALRTTSNSAMAVDFADIDLDGDIDFFEADMLSRDGRRRQTEAPTHTPMPKPIGRIDDRPQMMRNTLFMNRGDTTYAQISYYAGVEDSDWSWSTNFLDVDLDGYEDILLTTGHVWDVMDSDTKSRGARGAAITDWRMERFLYPVLHLKNVIFRNKGDLTFDEVAEEWGFADEEDVSHGLALGDLDGDGDLDVVTNRLGFPAGVFRNDATGGRVAVRLLGEPPNTQGVGAIIRVLGGVVPEQQKEVTIGGTYLSGSEPMYSFAAGDANQVTIVVEWQRGAATTIDGAIPNRLYEIREPSGVDTPIPQVAESAREDDVALFSDVSNALGHVHVETSFDDYWRQPLLPNALSRLGPGTSWYDFDADGDEDLLVTSGAGGRLAVYRNDLGSFTVVNRGIPEAHFDQTTVVAIPDAAGGSVLLVGQSSYEARNPNEALSTASVLRLDDAAEPSRFTAAVPGDYSSTGPLALADYDNDGDLDLFVGGRVVPGVYPVAASSRLFKNDNGRFEPDRMNEGSFARIGLVSAATFTDFDGDGDVDIALAIEWGAIRLFVNEGGLFSEAGPEYGLSSFISRWNGLTTGDLNADGRLDIVATSWGRNTQYDASVDRPLELFFGDFDQNGSLDLLEAQYDTVRRGTYPLAGYLRMASALPMMTHRLTTFAEYADADIEEVVGPTFRQAQHLETVTLDHTVFVNRGRFFEAVSLPAEAQFAPAFYAGVTDFNGDGNEDLFVSQNFFPTELGTPRYDAGRSLLMFGDGNGGLRPVSGNESGLKVYGDQRAAAFADYDGDARVDLVVSQNGAETKLFHNDGAEPGLRVRLVGPPGNPQAIGAQIRILYADGAGPVREIHAGSGYWAVDGSVQVLGLREDPAGVWVRWPGGGETQVPLDLAEGELEVTIRLGEN